MTELRIEAKPQRWLWWANAIIQLPLSLGALAIAATDTTSGQGMRIFMGSLGLCLFGLWIFSIHMLLRMRGESMFVVVASDHIEVPSMWSKSSLTIPYTEIEKAVLQEIDGGGMSFFQLVVTYRENFQKKTAVVPQQLIGREALDQVHEALESNGVAVG